MDSKLYGLAKSNRTGDNLWGKNQFNSTFPASLACYMRDHDISAVYINASKDLDIRNDEVSVDFIFNTSLPNSDIEFSFETVHEPYQKYCYDKLKGIDLVVKHDGNFIRPLEVKLTVIPDNATKKAPEAEWGSEIVIRPASTSYCALGIAHRCLAKKDIMRQILEPTCSRITDWENVTEILSRISELKECLNTFMKEFNEYQAPFLMQPIWKTKGQSPELADRAFDLFVWSDFALCQAFIARSSDALPATRYTRATARLARALFQLSTSGKINISEIYHKMSLGNQTDKELGRVDELPHVYFAGFAPRKFDGSTLIFDSMEDLDVDEDERTRLGTCIGSISGLPPVCWCEGKEWPPFP